MKKFAKDHMDKFCEISKDDLRKKFYKECIPFYGY